MEHNKSAEWINEVQKGESDRRKQEVIVIDAAKLRQQLGKLPKCKACGPDKVYRFWIKEFTNIHKKITPRIFTKCLENGKTPEWMMKGRTCLILKDEKKGNETSNFQPITCLPILRKVFTRILSKQVYGHVEREKLLPDE